MGTSAHHRAGDVDELQEEMGVLQGPVGRIVDQQLHAVGAGGKGCARDDLHATLLEHLPGEGAADCRWARSGSWPGWHDEAMVALRVVVGDDHHGGVCGSRLIVYWKVSRGVLARHGEALAVLHIAGVEGQGDTLGADRQECGRFVAGAEVEAAARPAIIPGQRPCALPTLQPPAVAQLT